MGCAAQGPTLFAFDEQYVRQLQQRVHRVEEHFSIYFQRLLTKYLRSRIKSPEVVEDVRHERLLWALRFCVRKRGSARNAWEPLWSHSARRPARIRARTGPIQPFERTGTAAGRRPGSRSAGYGAAPRQNPGRPTSALASPRCGCNRRSAERSSCRPCASGSPLPPLRAEARHQFPMLSKAGHQRPPAPHQACGEASLSVLCADSGEENSLSVAM